MDHPFLALKPEYTQLLAAMQVRPECKQEVDKVATKLLGFKSKYEPVSAKDGVPIILIAALFEREASSNFLLNAAQGWPLHSRSQWIPENGPFQDWQSSAIAAYHLNGLDKVGAGNWTWELMCFYGEFFNGFGYRDYHHMHTPYLWGATNIQTRGKYVKDSEFDPNEMDTQIGIIPIMRRMVELDVTLALTVVPYVAAPPVASGVAAVTSTTQAYDVKWLKTGLNRLGFRPALKVDDNYNFVTKLSVERFQYDYGLHVDGMVGEETTDGLKKALANMPEGT
jgi:lysozyme family protein